MFQTGTEKLEARRILAHTCISFYSQLKDTLCQLLHNSKQNICSSTGNDTVILWTVLQFDSYRPIWSAKFTSSYKWLRDGRRWGCFPHLTHSEQAGRTCAVQKHRCVFTVWAEYLLTGPPAPFPKRGATGRPATQVCLQFCISVEFFFTSSHWQCFEFPLRSFTCYSPLKLPLIGLIMGQLYLFTSSAAFQVFNCFIPFWLVGAWCSNCSHRNIWTRFACCNHHTCFVCALTWHTLILWNDNIMRLDSLF